MDRFVIPWKIGGGNIIVENKGGDQYLVSSDSENTTGATRTQTLTFTGVNKQSPTTTLTINQKTVSTDQELNGEWLKGIVKPEKSDWVQLFPELRKTYYLPWDPKYHWFDVNKLNPEADPGGVIDDGYMCWAAVSSGMLHWWFYMNKDYIDRYGRYEGPDPNWDDSREQESEIFTAFIKSFADSGGFVDQGVNWFIQGTIPTTPSQDTNPLPGGWFKEVFPESIKLGEGFSGIGKKRFNEVVKGAISSGKAVGFSSNRHVMNIWGAEVGEDGFINYIYATDNNDRSLFDDLGKYGCIRYKINYEDIFTKYSSEMIGSDSTGSIISKLFTLDLGQSQWEEYFNKNKKD